MLVAATRICIVATRQRSLLASGAPHIHRAGQSEKCFNALPSATFVVQGQNVCQQLGSCSVVFSYATSYQRDGCHLDVLIRVGLGVCSAGGQ